MSRVRWSARAPLIVATAVAIVAALAAPAQSSVRAGNSIHTASAPRAVAQWSMFEATLDVGAQPSNPYDPSVIDVRAVFVDPHGNSQFSLGFWTQDYTRALVNDAEQLTPSGTAHFAVRFTPERAGRYSWHWWVSTPAGVVTTRPQTLLVLPHRDPGFLRVSPSDARYLSFDNGSPYFAVGENVGWYDRGGTYDYDRWFAQLEQQHADFARVWMPSWAFGIEWNDTGLGDYTARLGQAWQLDHVFDLAQQDGIYLELSLLNHGAFSTLFNSEWAENPYNAANGGPLTSPAQFFTNATAQQYFVRRLRYIVARWGYSTHLLSWELWNEVDLTDGYNTAAVTAWHHTMADELRALDPNDHLVTTSFALYPNDPAVWAGGGLDYTQYHHYVNNGVFTWFPDVSHDVVDWTAGRIASTGKPVLFAELGVQAGGPSQTLAVDPDGVGIHDGLWAGVVSQGIGTAMTWWWDNLVDADPTHYYPMFGSVARFVQGVAWDRQSFTPATPSVTTASARPLLGYGLQGTSSGLWWLKDDAFQFDSPQRVDITDASLAVGALAPGTWIGLWYDTWSGKWIGWTGLVDPARGTTSIPVPTFHGDLALRWFRIAP